MTPEKINHACSKCPFRGHCPLLKVDADFRMIYCRRLKDNDAAEQNEAVAGYSLTPCRHCSQKDHCPLKAEDSPLFCPKQAKPVNRFLFVAQRNLLQLSAVHLG